MVRFVTFQKRELPGDPPMGRTRLQKHIGGGTTNLPLEDSAEVLLPPYDFALSTGMRISTKAKLQFFQIELH
jgi:hypothetical protein